MIIIRTKKIGNNSKKGHREKKYNSATKNVIESENNNTNSNNHICNGC